MKRFFAFTLAETLVVIGIIGIVSALTLPNLNSSTGEKEKVAKVKKLYQNLDEAYSRAAVTYGPFKQWFKNDSTNAAQTTRFAGRLTEYMKISKNCGSGAGCWTTADFQEYGNYYDNLKGAGFLFYTLADGTSLAISSSNSFARIKVDIDGPNKGPTVFGDDIFEFTISSYETNGQVPNQITPEMNPDIWDTTIYETAWVIYKENLDYLKCRNDLNWNTKTTCK